MAAGSYGVQGVAYSADTDPGETSATSERVSVTVGDAGAAAPGKGLPWWVYAAIAAAVLLVVIVIAVLLLGGGDDGEDSAAAETTDTADTPRRTPAAGLIGAGHQ